MSSAIPAIPAMPANQHPRTSKPPLRDPLLSLEEEMFQRAMAASLDPTSLDPTNPTTRRAATPQPRPARVAPSRPAPARPPAPVASEPVSSEPVSSARPIAAASISASVDPSGDPAVDPSVQPSIHAQSPVGVGAERMRRGLLITALVLAALLFVTKLWTRPPSMAGTTNAALVADELVAELANTQDVTSADGSFVPGVGLVLHVSASNVARESVSDWWARILAPLAPKFNGASTKDRLIATVRVTGNDEYARILIAPLTSLDVPSSYRLLAAVSQGAPTEKVGVARATENVTATTVPVVIVPPTLNPNAPNAPVSAAGGGTAKRPFTGDRSEWVPMSGRWQVADGQYQQLDASGFDYITQRNDSPADLIAKGFSVSVKVKSIEGPLNAGLIMFQPAPGKRNGATVVDLTNDNSYVRWGYFDDAGTYTFEGGLKLGVPVDGATGAVLKVEFRDNRGYVFLDGRQLGEFVRKSPQGTFGLITSQSAVGFSEFTLEALRN